MGNGSATGWTPEGAAADNAVSLLSELATSRRVPAPRGPAPDVTVDDTASASPLGAPARQAAVAALAELAAPASPELAAPASSAIAAPSSPVLTAAQLLAAAPVLERAMAAGMPPTEIPSSPRFSDDGRWWWDGQRWVPSGAVDEQVREVVRRRRRPATVWAGVVALVLGLATLAAAPVLWDGRTQTTDQVLQEALLHAAGAQQRHLVDHGSYTASDSVLGRYVAGEPGVPAGVTVQVHRADAMTFCLSAAAPGSRGVLWLSESGEVSTAPCL